MPRTARTTNTKRSRMLKKSIKSRSIKVIRGGRSRTVTKVRAGDRFSGGGGI